ncbi:NADH dehydrogenase [Arboricoccus pini]|uniref:NADH dehydrogenase n=1 Tax=Arboricoccus pini TaxID=1963835 RepID=A0A212QZM6_9PROT|nr:complex I NDUFA9 subunit family protein [Arboricoccus pini]SNB65183.1 NADH dehydrogenase [Arboricoccus pini]
MRGKVVTVFGGSGFIGRHLIRRLAARGATIRVPARDVGTTYQLRPLGEVGQIVAMPTSLSEASIARAVEGADFVVNLIGILHGDFERLQARLPGVIGAAARAGGATRFVQMSAIGADAASRSRYARTKAEGEASALQSGPEVVILRPSILFGPEDQFLNKFARMTRFAPALPLIGGGTMRFQPVYVGDVADAIVKALDGHAVDGQVYELGGPNIYTFKELLEYLLRLLGRRRLLLNLPWSIAEIEARLFELLPEPPFTRDQLLLLRLDNVVADGAAGLSDLGLAPTPLEAIVPAYLAPRAKHFRHSAI